MPIEKRWVVKPQGDPATVEALASALRIPPVLANLLVQRVFLGSMPLAM